MRSSFSAFLTFSRRLTLSNPFWSSSTCFSIGGNLTSRDCCSSVYSLICSLAFRTLAISCLFFMAFWSYYSEYWASFSFSSSIWLLILDILLYKIMFFCFEKFRDWRISCEECSIWVDYYLISYFSWISAPYVYFSASFSCLSFWRSHSNNLIISLCSLSSLRCRPCMSFFMAASLWKSCFLRRGIEAEGVAMMLGWPLSLHPDGFLECYR